MKPLDCEAAEQLFSDFLAGALNDDALTQLGQHLQSCEACRARSVTLARQDRALTEFSAQSRMPALRKSIHQALLSETRPVAPSISATLPRIRRRKSARRKSSPGSFVFPLLAAAGICMVVGLFVFQNMQKKTEESTVALLQSYTGGVALTRGGKPVELTMPQNLLAADTLVLGDGAQAMLGYANEGTTVLLDGGTTVRVDPSTNGKRIHLSAGALSARVSPQPAGKPMIFTTALAQAEVVGTSLELKTTPAETRLEVNEGKVRLQRQSDRATVDVAANFFAVATGSAPMAALPILQTPVPATREQRKRILTQAEQKDLQTRATQRNTAVLTAVKQFTEKTSQGPKGAMKYRLFTPPAVAGLKHPVVMFLHGTGGGGRDNRKQLDDQPFGAGLWALPENQQRFPCIVLAPQTQGGWEGPAHQLALQCLDDVLKDPNVDPTRVYITGLSSGGFGTFACLESRPQQFAAAIALSGWLPDPNKIPMYAHVPIWILHGNVDTIINVNQSRRAYDLLAKAGADVRYDEFDKAGHGIFGMAYNTPDFVDWLSARHK